jgi:catechol 2,3-dioxygenase-like lactoylglutathione lyase family enzyme
VRVDGVLETCVYAADLGAAEAFYADVLGLEVYSRESGRHVFFRCGEAMFLVFSAARTSQPGESHSLSIPPHGASGPGHVAFRVAGDAVQAWRERLRNAGVTIEADIHWPGGGESIYVRDPAGNSVEIATAALWGL